MAVFKCKMCGGNLEAAEGQNIGTCDSCGSTMTLPKANDERIVNLFNRATHYRQQNEFDKAIATYESILEEDNENAEAYWGLVLSKYGIEYVEDPKTHKRIPTCHRLQHTSILADLDYQSALKYAIDYDAEKLYKNEAETISEIQKNILSVANNEEAYDIFICYKETDNSGKRTMDSVLVQDIYSQLINEGYKVFFSRITLEDKLGQEYEPYIFSALNSAKVMLVVGTDKDNFNAVWVKNEWSRFLALSRKDKNKVIIPCYKDMDAYDLPDELSMFQSQDMNKIGFLQDLIRGIKKILTNKNETSKTTVVQPVQTVRDYKAEAESMLKRAFLFLEEAEWTKANDLLEKVLNIEPENAKAYLGKLMIELKVNKAENLAECSVNLSEYPDYQKSVRFADVKLKETLKMYNTSALQKFDVLQKQNLEQKQNRMIEIYKKSSKAKRIYPQIAICSSIIACILVVCIILGIRNSDPYGYDGVYSSFITMAYVIPLFYVSILLFCFICYRHHKKESGRIKEILKSYGMSLDEIQQLTKDNGKKSEKNKEETTILFSHTCSKCGYTFKVKYDKPTTPNKTPVLSTICPKCKSKEIIKEKNL